MNDDTPRQRHEISSDPSRPDAARIHHGRFTLATEDAHGVYEKVGFKPLKDPHTWMYIRLGRAGSACEGP
ncbi:hypothetical protein NRF20_35675 [Streptomyces sp. R-74717]|uniref:hypothetical protein n=1 Tax=Streptomyces sp. R-74717 TaxID=2969820 RepID=UPI0039B50727